MSNILKIKSPRPLWLNFVLPKSKRLLRKGIKICSETRRTLEILLNPQVNRDSQAENMMAQKLLIWLIKTSRSRFCRANKLGLYCFTHLHVGIAEALSQNLRSCQDWWERKWTLQEWMQQCIQRWLKSIKWKVSRQCFYSKVRTNKNRSHTRDKGQLMRLRVGWKERNWQRQWNNCTNWQRRATNGHATGTLCVLCLFWKTSRTSRV